MLKIFKYPLAVYEGVEEIEMPVGAKILCVQAQRDAPCAWALVDPEAPKQKRRFRTYGTGCKVTDIGDLPVYVGTYQLYDGSLVFHVFTTAD